ncbi:MAG TPA: hypothetical protein VK483_17540 [Chitinophagaceae bacterium]|nr:hypothetical protein [Chitinophagaceae bacterium]
MKSIISKTMSLVAIAATLLSFSPKPGIAFGKPMAAKGGEGFEISLNNKVLIQRFGSDINTVSSLQLNPAASNDQLIIKYHHCGRVGKNRVVTIRDGQNNLLKEFRYADVSTPVAAMSLPVKDILNLKKGNANTLKLYYTSTELPNGRLLTSIVLGRSAVAQP